MLELKEIVKYVKSKYFVGSSVDVITFGERNFVRNHYNFEKRIISAINSDEKFIILVNNYICFGHKELDKYEFLNKLYRENFLIPDIINNFVYINLEETNLFKVDLFVSLNTLQSFCSNEDLVQNDLKDLYAQARNSYGEHTVRENRFLTYLKPFLSYVETSNYQKQYVVENVRKILSKHRKHIVSEVIDYLISLEPDAITTGLLAKIMTLHTSRLGEVADKLFLHAASFNDPLLRYQLGVLCYYEKNVNQASEWLERSLKNGYIPAKSITEMEYFKLL